MNDNRKDTVRTAVGSVCVAAMLLSAGVAAFADNDGAVSMAPPVSQSSASVDMDNDGTSMAPPVAQDAQPIDVADVSGDNVFNWTEVPANQRVPLDRAVFDQSGYQLYDSVGETIVVPFQNDDLYVMKFAVSPDGSTFFVNSGTTPVLYLPQDGYLTNNAASGARWYPFTNDFHPDTPVFVGIAPSWDAFIGMGWYPGMCCYGGYWGDEPFIAGGIFFPCIGLFFDIGGNHYHGWGGYRGYLSGHPAPYHWHGRGFGGGGFGHRSGAYGGFRGAGESRGFGSTRTFGGSHSFNGGGGARVFRGAGSGFAAGGRSGFSEGHSFGSGGSFGGSHVFRGAGSSFGGGGDHSYGGGHSFSGGGSGDHAVSGGGGGTHTFSGGGGGGGFRGGGGDGGGGGFHGGGGGGGGFRGGGGGHRR